MPVEVKNSKVISKKNAGFPDYLDFNKLRSDSISYLGELSGKIWTDHNVHDPGITILEVLIYALLDLGYRTSLPKEDIFAKDPEDKKPDNNFYTPAEILTCNPLTITDYRKLLIDIKGVKNAWLDIAGDVSIDKICPDEGKDFDNNNEQEQDAGKSCCIEYLNGLYHVYLQTDDKYPDDAEKQQKFQKETVRKVKDALMSHRNLCEDFIDIHLLCKIEIGVCADVELETNADAGKVYIKLAESLQAFFSPSPKFYTLQQLLDKNKSIDEIFAGRPFNITESHGFVDTSELESIKLKREIHLSDVYNLILKTDGIKTVRNLKLRNCNDVWETKKGKEYWKFAIPENYIPEFSIKCSVFHFSRNENTVSVDFKKYESYFKYNFTNNGKVLYKKPSPYLDAEIKYGLYRNDLSEYLSVQNDFPQLYGIGEGQLPANVSDERKSQALQLKGYLLFFDQLLVNYLGQLKNIRNLFALSAPGEENRHTYFINKLESVPELNKLLRFKTDDSDAGFPGNEGSILAFPVEKKMLEEKIISGEILKCDFVKELQEYTFATASDCEVVTSQLKEDLKYGRYEPVITANADDCFFFYFFTSSECIAITSKKYYPDQKTAAQAAASVMYLGTIEQNYRKYIATETDRFSFDIEFNLTGYLSNLQEIVENKEQYYSRRNIFLDHLLSRFAERFTDFTLLSFGLFNDNELKAANVSKKELFLGQYPDLSSNRGKAYDFTVNGWNNDNISGFEKKFKALAGIEDWKKHSLCNFEVFEHRKQYEVAFTFAGKKYFSTPEKFETTEDAIEAARLLFESLSDRNKYKTDKLFSDQQYPVRVYFQEGREAFFSGKYDEKDEAEKVCDNLHRIFSGSISSEKIPNSYIYKLQLQDYTGGIIRTSVEDFESEVMAGTASQQTIERINDKEKWEIPEEDTTRPGNLFLVKEEEGMAIYIDKTFFKIDINDTIFEKPGLFTYNLLDIENKFILQAQQEFRNEKEASVHADKLLTLLSEEENFKPYQKPDTRKYSIQIIHEGAVQATCSSGYDTEPEAIRMKQKIVNIVKRHQYFLSVHPIANRWKFIYNLGYDKNQLYRFESKNDFDSTEITAAPELFSKSITEIDLKDTGEEILLVPRSKKKTLTACKFTGIFNAVDRDSIKEAMIKLLEQQKEVQDLIANPALKKFSSSVRIDQAGLQGTWAYRLADKDNIPAFYKKEYSKKTDAEKEITAIVNQYESGLNYLQICMGGDGIINERKEDKTKKIWYHYKLVSLHGKDKQSNTGDKDIVLFESTKGYESREEAAIAFKENYFKIIHLASDAINYTANISLETDLQKILVHSDDPCLQNESTVFVPETTQKELGGSAAAVITKLVKITLTYPIRIEMHKSANFYDLFKCEKKEDKPVISDCKKEAEKDIYYFILPAAGAGKESWQSTRYYTAAEEALEQFNFFLLLLAYKGNYYIDCDDCNEKENKYRIYVREVLAESTERFISEESAWGKDGVQKFICISQSPDAFHTYNYAAKEDCCYSFYVACSDGLVYHPCKYDTPQKRDAVSSQLWRLLNQFNGKRSYSAELESGSVALLNEDGKYFARIFKTDNNKNECISDLIIDLKNNLDENENNYIEEGGYISLKNKENKIVVSSYKEGFEKEQWKDMLCDFLCYYPVVKTKNEKTKQDEYCIEIKLPGFSACKENNKTQQSCDCKEEDKNRPACNAAWISRCCYNSCAEAEAALQEIIKLLLNKKYYQHLFDCTCSEYSLALQYSKPELIEDESISYYQDEAYIKNWSHAEIAARNPQCYPAPDIACKAVERAKKLINSEGLDIVEHILLRPYSAEDCDCLGIKKSCCLTYCDWEWKDPQEDVCLQKESACFIPGNDPYSFIATIALPAWPVRFRTIENRRIIENMLYREAPAHVLLRILWLTPHDFCCFEKKFKNWNRLLADKKTCIDDFTLCNFLDFLFQRNFECLDECNVCLPCIPEESTSNSCLDEIKEKEKPREFLNQVNRFFCWQEIDCEGKYIECETGMEATKEENNDFNISEDIPVAEPVNIRTKNDQGLLHAHDTTITLEENQPVTASGGEEIVDTISLPNDKSKINFINSRHEKYKAAIENITKINNTLPAGLAGAFVKDSAPSTKRLSKLVTAILENKGTEDAAALSPQQQQDLLNNSISHYLDKVCFNGNDEDKISALKPVIDELLKAGVDAANIYNYWRLPEIKKYQPKINMEKIKKILSVIRKA